MTLSSNSVDVVLCCYAVCALSHNLLVDRASRGPIVCIARLISWWSDWSISKKLCCGIWVASTREWRTLYCKNIYKPHTEWRRGFACEWRGSLTFVIASPRIYLLNCLGKTCIFFFGGILTLFLRFINMLLRINLAWMWPSLCFIFHFLWDTLSNDWSLGFLPTNGDAMMRNDSNLRFELPLSPSLGSHYHCWQLYYVARRNPPPQRLYLTFSPIDGVFSLLPFFF